MYQQDWLDVIQWKAVLIGVLIAVSLQVLLTLVVMVPLGLTLSWAAVALVELCIVVGAFVTGWRAQEGLFLNSLATALVCAIISLAATVARTPADLNLFGVLFLFGTFAIMGALGGLIAARLPSHNNNSTAQFSTVRRAGR
ncbi:MAG: TIGR04086 family membrane protein [Chloroflexi bacterium AL-W]|nr:TIGR04086 family membrane protein [Chloroflexi bacterium AL-N1]NOK67768.1 TIGR04086 family membrane protein [Chloroflexi bacterium AL-N10]NOK75462.1 TIGR04086 family membrane protein [Chloroflexi bacterium AL-N5]NOK82250.1 TIGR04086 family membrane protein [Chloroflexi bacterium AL-W]NOK90095.1 TIGR04086 family membrane protein [Chloroflexi bacterium AL-N15]